MTSPARVICGIVFALCMIVGFMFSAVAATVALLAAVLLGAWSWFPSSSRAPRALRAAWWIGLLLGAVVMWIHSPRASVGGTVQTCQELPALRVGDGDSTRAPTPQTQFLQEVHQRRVELLAQTAAMLRAYELLPQARTIARALESRDATQAKALTADADRLQARLLADGLGAPAVMEARAKRLQTQLNQFVYDVDRDGMAVDIDARKAQLARLVKAQSFDATFPALSTLNSTINRVVSRRGDLTFETSYEVALEPSGVRYDERVDLHLKHGHFVSVDLIELALQVALATPGAEIIVGGDGMLATTFDARTLQRTVNLPTQPRSIWVLARTRVADGVTPTCSGVSVFSFQKARLTWPHPFDMQVRGLAQLILSDEPVPFEQRIDKRTVNLSQVELPYSTVFKQIPVRLKPSNKHIEGDVLERFEPVETTNIANFDMTVELLPKSGVFRNATTYRNRHLFFPLNWVLALFYVAIASYAGARFVGQ